MFVGSADGSLAFIHLDACRGDGRAEPESRAVRCGVSGVDVEWLAEGQAGPAHIFATSDQAVMVRLNPTASLHSESEYSLSP